MHRPQNVPVPVTPPPVVTKPGTFTAEAELKTDELMDLGDSLGEVLKTAVPNTLKLSVRIELGGEPKASEAKARALEKLSDVAASKVTGIETALKPTVVKDGGHPMRSARAGASEAASGELSS